MQFNQSVQPECPRCHFFYSSPNHLPMIMCVNEHINCLQCAKNLSKKQSRCPICKSKFKLHKLKQDESIKIHENNKISQNVVVNPNDGYEQSDDEKAIEAKTQNKLTAEEMEDYLDWRTQDTSTCKKVLQWIALLIGLAMIIVAIVFQGKILSCQFYDNNSQCIFYAETYCCRSDSACSQIDPSCSKLSAVYSKLVFAILLGVVIVGMIIFCLGCWPISIRNFERCYLKYLRNRDLNDSFINS